MELIDLGKIKIDTRNPRKHIDPSDLAELQADIESNGLISPIGVRKRNATEYTLIYGQRRLMACKNLGMESIPAIVHNVDAKQALVMMISENLSRSNILPGEESRAVLELRKSSNLSTKDIAKSFGKSVQWVASRLRIGAFSDHLIAWLNEGRLSIADCLQLAKIEEPARTQIAERNGSIAYEANRELCLLSTAEFPVDFVHNCNSCSTCVTRSDRQPDLFGEVEDNARCMNSECFSNMGDAWYDKLTEGAESMGYSKLPNWQRFEIETDETEIAKIKALGINPKYTIRSGKIELHYIKMDEPEQPEEDVQAVEAVEDALAPWEHHGSNAYKCVDKVLEVEDEEPETPKISPHMLRAEIRNVFVEKIGEYCEKNYSKTLDNEKIVGLIAKFIVDNVTCTLDYVQLGEGNFADYAKKSEDNKREIWIKCVQSVASILFFDDDARADVLALADIDIEQVKREAEARLIGSENE